MTPPANPAHGPDAAAPGPDRRAELATRLAAVRSRVNFSRMNGSRGIVPIKRQSATASNSGDTLVTLAEVPS